MKNKKTLILSLACSALLLVSCKTPSATNKPIDLSTPQAQLTSLVQQATPPLGANTEEQQIRRTILATLVTTKDKNWEKQYERLLCDQCREKIALEEYSKIWSDEFAAIALDKVVAKNNDITYEENKEISAFSKKFAKVATITVVYSTADGKEYTPKNTLLSTMSFVPAEDGTWRFLWVGK